MIEFIAMCLAEYSFPTAHCSWIAPTLRRCLEMTRASNLQLDIYVSRDDKTHRIRPSRDGYFPSSQSGLSLPNPGFSRSERNNYESDMSDNEGGPAYPRPSTDSNDGTQDSVTDMIFFDGEDPTPTTAELELSSKIRKTGKVRRAKSRADQGYVRHSRGSPAHHTTQLPDRNLSPWNSRASPDKNQSNNRPPSFLNYDPSPSAPHPIYGSGGNGSMYAASGSFAELGGNTDGHSLAPTSSRRGLIGGEEPQRTRSKQETDDEEVYVDVTQEDQADLDAVAELARPGMPKLDKILDEEIAKSRGKIMVACEPLFLSNACVCCSLTLKKLNRLWSRCSQYSLSKFSLVENKFEESLERGSKWRHFVDV